MAQRTAIIIGAGPAGLTAAYELLHRTDVKPIIFEMSGDIGGISKTVNYRGNRIDIGGHRFFSKSDRVMNWWQSILPLQGSPSWDDRILERRIPMSTEPGAPDPERTDRVMLIRSRLSRILYLRKFFPYPISLSSDTLRNLGLWRTAKIGASYSKSRLSPIRKEKSLEDFLVNRFGRVLYEMFFRDYTEKVWGVPCKEISREWGVQRIKGLSISKAIRHALQQMVRKDQSISQKGTETSLIEQFLYPKFGPGQMWEEVSRVTSERGAEIHLHNKVIGAEVAGDRLVSVDVRNEKDGTVRRVAGDLFFSTMPVKDLIAGMRGPVPDTVREVARGLMYRDFITVGLLLKGMKVRNETTVKTVNGIIPDNWIYVQEPDVKLGRIQIFNNWSPYMVSDKGKIWLGLEYFGNDGDSLWGMSDAEFEQFAAAELVKIGFIGRDDAVDSVVIRMPKTYPAYFGSYPRFDVIKEFVNTIGNLFLIGRNGMHRYNNQDHSMLTAMTAVDNIVAGVRSKSNLWDVNAEEEYHEGKQELSRRLKPR